MSPENELLLKRTVVTFLGKFGSSESRLLSLKSSNFRLDNVVKSGNLPESWLWERAKSVSVVSLEIEEGK
ncbi:hypothetical protein HanRHA438_Chr15g0721421 [Helianthus annuus]|nr:hypothetical protein HanRHA438_Chr15g0721421 [Helianthus annuus]